MKASKPFARDWDEVMGMMDEVVRIRKENPAIWNLVCPRRIASPKGYIKTTINSALMSIYLDFMFRPKPNKVEVDAILSTWKVCEALVPTIFVGREFAEALVNTEPPDNLVIRELKWPFDGMVFVVHDDFMWNYFRRAVPFIRIARHPTGKQRAPEIVRKVYPNAPEFGISEASYDQSCFIVTATVMFGDKPVDYSASFPDNEPLGEMISDEQYQDFTVDPEDRVEMAEICNTTEAEDRELLKRIISFSGHLLLAMNAVPEQIEAPVIQWPVKEKIQRRVPQRDWVWHPHFLGRNYRWERERASQGGSHASPRLHPRRGHWRHQPYGPGRKEKKVIWIKPMLVGAKPERTV